jgi:predicted PurR-regulated permease PerM
VQLLTPSEPRTRFDSIALAVAGLGAAIALLYYGRAFCITLVASVILAFMLDPFVRMFMRMKLPRGVASFIVCMIGLLVLYLLALGLYTQIAGLVDDLPAYSQRINVIVDNVAERIDQTERNVYRVLVPKRFQEPQPPPPEPATPKSRRLRQQQQPSPPAVQEVRLKEDKPSVMEYLAGYVGSVYNSLLMFSFVPFLVYFMLSWRDHVRKSFLALFAGPDRTMATRSWQAIGSIARAYVVGNFILGLIISLASCVIFSSWYLPYWILIGFVSGFLSLIPYVGLPLAVLPAMAGALMTYNTVPPYLLIALQVAVLHLLALNLLYPAVVGARVHLNPLVVTVALMFWGSIWGGIGLVLAIPITAALKALCDNTEGLQAYGRLLGDS